MKLIKPIAILIALLLTSLTANAQSTFAEKFKANSEYRVGGDLRIVSNKTQSKFKRGYESLPFLQGGPTITNYCNDPMNDCVFGEGDEIRYSDYETQDDNSTSLGIFGQYRYNFGAISGGVHIAYPHDKTDTWTQEIMLTNHLASTPILHTATTEIEKPFDLLGIAVWNKSGELRPYVMAGFSWLKVKQSLSNEETETTRLQDTTTVRGRYAASSSQSSETLSGLKFGIGIEGNYPNNDNFEWTFGLETVKYKGDIDQRFDTDYRELGSPDNLFGGPTTSTHELEVSKTAIRFAVQYKF